MYSDLEIFDKANAVMNNVALSEKQSCCTSIYSKRWFNISKDGVLNYEGRTTANYYDAKTGIVIIINRAIKPDKTVINICLDDSKLIHVLKMSVKSSHNDRQIKTKHYLEKKVDNKGDYRKLSEIDSSDSSIGAANEMIMRLINEMLDSIQSTYEYDYM